MILFSPAVDTRLHQLAYPGASAPRSPLSSGIQAPDYQMLTPAFHTSFGPLFERHLSDLNSLGRFLLEIVRHTLLLRTASRDSITTLQQWLLAYVIRQHQFDIADFILCELEEVIADSIKMGHFMPYAHLILYILVGGMGRTTREPGTDLFMESVEEWSHLPHTFPNYRPAKIGDRRHGQWALVPLSGILQQLTPEQRT